MNIRTAGLGLALIAVVGIGLYLANQNGRNEGALGTIEAGFDVSKVSCEEIAQARDAVNKELTDRKSDASVALSAALNAASDAYWETRRSLEEEKRLCESEANLADPCKEAFEEVGRLYEEIMADFRADKGFNEAKFNEREEAKKRYNDCVENPPKEATSAGKLEQCMLKFNEANEAALANRAAEENAARAEYESKLSQANSQYTEKMNTLSELEKRCEETKYERLYGNLPNTGLPATEYMGGSSACTGIFPGKDPELQRQIDNLRSQLNKAKAAGKTDGFMGTTHLSQAIADLEAEMRDGEARCTTDVDCGGPETVCCNVQEIGRAFCDGGICKHEIVACGSEEVCAGKPAQCLSLIQVIEYQGKYIPTSQLRIGEIHPPDEHGGCPDRHWHSDVPVTAIDGTVFTDPARNACGFGELSKKPAFSIRGNPTPPAAVIPQSGATIQIRGGIIGN